MAKYWRKVIKIRPVRIIRDFKLFQITEKHKKQEDNIKISLIKERKVENIELFYDLIFVYVISKISVLIHHPS